MSYKQLRETMNQVIISVGNTPDGTKIQLEDWSQALPDISRKFIIASYPVAKETNDEAFEPRRGKTFLCQLSFETLEEATETYKDLVDGRANIKGFEKEMYKPKHIKYI